MTLVDYLVDKSALARVGQPTVDDQLLPPLDRGLLGVSILTELEVGFSALSMADYRRTRDRVMDHLIPVPLPIRAEARAREVQADLVERGQHRAVSVPDLLIAATAEIEKLTVLHYDADFELIADITGQPVEWVVPRGSVD